MTDHTPEPYGPYVHGETRHDRIIACVNACAGIPTDQLEDYWTKVVSTLTEQNWDRLAACANACAGIPTERLQPESFAQLRRAARCADEAINPKDRAAISMHEWNKRLKAATSLLRAALAPFRED